MTDKAIGPLRRRLLEDMAIRRFSSVGGSRRRQTPSMPNRLTVLVSALVVAAECVKAE